MQRAQSLAHLVKFEDWLCHYFIRDRMYECFHYSRNDFLYNSYLDLSENVR
jgi:hypothetical protein